MQELVMCEIDGISGGGAASDAYEVGKLLGAILYRLLR